MGAQEATTKRPAPPAEPEARAGELAPPRPSSLAAWQAETSARQIAAVARVDRLVRSRTSLAEGLQDELQSLRETGAALDRAEAEATAPGLLASLGRVLGRRSGALARQSIAAELLRQYEVVTASLQRASAFTDELELCARELQREVDQLHERVGRARTGTAAAAARVEALSAQLAALDAPGGPTNADGQAIPEHERARLGDRLRYEERSESTALALFRASAELAADELGPARALRDTVLALHADMARFVLEATSAVNTSGRKVQALGLAADTPLVVTELHAALEQLDATMAATASTIDEAHALLTQVLPALNREIRSRTSADHLLLRDDLDSLSRERAREQADRALREAAEAEVQHYLRTDET